MGVIAKRIPRGCQGLFTPVSLGYPLSVFNKNTLLSKLILIWNVVFGHVPTPAKHVLLVHMNMLQGLKIHQGLKIKHIFTHQKLECLLVNVEPRELRWLGDRLPIQRSLVRTSGRDKKLFYKKSLVSKIASTFKTRATIFQKRRCILRKSALL